MASSNAGALARRGFCVVDNRRSCRLAARVRANSGFRQAIRRSPGMGGN